MALEVNRQIHAVNVDYVGFQTSERGGVVSYGSASGMVILEYATSASGAIPLGIQLNDVEYLDLSKQIHPRKNRRVEQPLGTMGVLTDGDFTTDWLSLTGTINTGDPAYVGPSGTITNDSTLNNICIGYFLGILRPEPHLVLFAGRGFDRLKMENGQAPGTKVLVYENNPADRIWVCSPGWAKIHIDQGVIQRSQKLIQGL